MVGKVSRGRGRAADFFRARVLISRGAVATFRGMTTARKSRSAAAASAAALLACALLAAAGCGGRPDEAREARHPLLRKAAAAREAEDADRAIALCERLLRRHPDNSAAHRELALLLDHYRDDAPGAIVHYRRYLELRPDSAQREAVEEMLHHCEVAYGAHLVQAPDSLKRELAAKDARIRELELEVVQLREARDGTGPAIAVPRSVAKDARAKAAAAETAATRTHVVGPGETLATISKKYYGTPARWKDIHQANRDRLPDANRVREGMELTIPE